MATLASENSIHDDDSRNIVMHVNFSDKERLVFVLNNVENILNYYQAEDKQVSIRVICHGPGLNLLRTDTTPDKNRLVQMADNLDELSFYACTNTLEKMTKAEGKQPDIIEQAILVPAGLPEIIELQCLGWTYLKP